MKRIKRRRAKSDKELIDELLAMIEESSGKTVIVEGFKDKQALFKMGFIDVLSINRLPLYRVVEALQRKKEIIILTDLDAEGKKLYSRLKDELNARGVRVDDGLRQMLFKTDLRQIEGLPNYFRRISTNRNL